MRWNSESSRSYYKRVEQWHPWFAWRPVRIGDKIVWLETVDRQLFNHMLDLWDYRTHADKEEV